MHYANGREAKNGDKVVLFGYAGPVVGILYNATAGNEHCNGNIAVTKPGDPCPNLKECLHIDDVLGLLHAQTGALAERVGRTSQDVELASVPDRSKAS